MSPLNEAPARVHEGFPRVSGDEPPGVSANHALKAFSPRERG